MWRSIASNALTLFVVGLVLLGGVILWGKGQYTGAGPLEQAICLQVKPGSTMRRVSEDLAAQGAISDARILRIGADYSEKAGQLKAGSFLIAPGASMQQIVDQVTTSGRSTCGTEVNFRIGVLQAELQVRELDPETNAYVEVMAFDPGEGAAPADYAALTQEADVRYRVVLAEGVTSWQVVNELMQAEFLTGEVADLPAEGAMAPDSYEVVRGADRAELIARMEASQAATLAELWEGRAEGLPLNSPEEALILASIVEKETGVAEERPQVASVFINRLNKGIALQTDPTVIYGLTLGKGALGRGLRRSELRKETPYNTYVINGLPPTPIANPGRASIEAALNPAETEFIYFVADGTGGHAFATTLKEHNANVAKWRKIEAERSNQ
ncbi:endolytic transglycosylase MltG [Actibacterium sp. XHP0104]|uniref:endolytic transglycosylase MltG n=1 Tax=Actibacterium sp. XHP0104 TaxID=2984335 RepID=UPI0021E70B72|nr:endolytic transglycosylase MltG [Actibacterium sp. XHP0104]MCV2880972.1 endolytic transglycosylase MltG [Actibacterium sp. XHP0104]